MKRFRPALAFLAVMIAVVASRGQPAGEPTPTTEPLAVTMLPAIDDANIVAELKLSADQVETLVAHRQAEWDEQYTTAPKKFAEGSKARNESADALLKKTLTEKQYKRLVQIAAQNALSDRGFGGPETSFTLTRVRATTFKLHPELVAAFKLTDEQKKQVNAPRPKTSPKDGFGGGSRTVIITMAPEQVAAAKEFLGETFDQRWAAKSDPRQRSAPRKPQHFALLEAGDVRADVQFTADQLKAMTPLSDKWDKLATERQAELSPKEADAKAGALKGESERFLAATLKPEQAARLKQITFQTSLGRGFGGGGFGTPPAPDFHIERVYTSPEVAKEVALTEAQAAKIKGAWEAFRAAAEKELVAAETADAARKKLKELANARRKSVEAALEPAQLAKLDALVGKPFTGTTRSDRSRGPGGPSQSPIARNLRAGSFGVHTGDLAYLATSKAVQEELKLSEKQIKQAAEANDELRAMGIPPFPSDDENAKAYREEVVKRSKFIGEALAKILTKDQAKRFRELMLQAREPRPAGPGGGFTTAIRSAVSYPGVAEAVKLTDDQKTKLIDGAEPGAVLTDEQKAAIKAMLGEPFKGDLALAPVRPAGPDRPGGTVSSTPANARRYSTFGNYTEELSELAGNTAVQEELKLKPEQIKNAAELRDEVAKFELPRLSSRTVEEYAKAYGERSKKVEEALAKLLDKNQAARFREVMMQFRDRGRGGPVNSFAGGPVASAVSYPGVAAEVKLTDEQRMKMILGTPPADVLSAEQKSAIAKLLGTLFKGEPLAPAGRPTFTRAPISPLIRAMGVNKDAVAGWFKLTEDQSKKLNAAWDVYQNAFGGGGLPLAEADAARTEFNKAAAGLLTADQEKRLAQLRLQVSASSDLGAALTSADTAKALELTPEQIRKINAIGEEAVKLQDLASAEQVSTTPERKVAFRLRDAADDRMMAVLTDAQKAQWKELTGDPFPGLEKTIPRGRGGFGGGLGGGLGGGGSGGFGGP